MGGFGKRVAEERNAWKAQKGILEQLLLALEAGLEQLSERLENLDESVRYSPGGDREL